MLNTKSIILLRHAKSSWASPELDDYDRPLNERGLNDTIKCEKLYKTLIASKSQIISSSAQRTRQTAKKTCHFFNCIEKGIVWIDDLYLASAKKMLKIINMQPDIEDNLVVIGHNNGISHLAQLLTNSAEVSHMPTLAAVKINFSATSWNEIFEGNGVLESFYYPKMIKPSLSK
jgi:phosphohistidine phosphatase